MLASKKCFIAEKTESEVREYFERRAGGILKPKEGIKAIERRYAPVGVFEITRKEEVKAGVISKVEKTIEKRNRFYVNLNDADLYYMSRGMFGKKSRIEGFDVIERIIDLPPVSIEFLSNIVKKGRITYNELNKKHFLFLNGNLDYIMMLKARDLIDFHSRVYGKDYEIRMPYLEYLSKINILNFDDRRYNIGAFLSTEQIDLEDKQVDNLLYKPEEVLDILKIFFVGDGISQDIIYLPYDECVYADAGDRLRHDRLIALKLSALN